MREQPEKKMANKEEKFIRHMQCVVRHVLKVGVLENGVILRWSEII